MEILLYAIVIPLLIAFVLYRLDPKGWQNTFKRLSTLIRANINSSKPVKKLEQTVEKEAKETWTAEFMGLEPSTGKKHEIIKTYYAKVGGGVHPHFKCKCGFSDFWLDLPTARKEARKHVERQNEAERLLELSNGGNAWEL